MYIPQFSKDSEFLKYDWDKFVQMCVGDIVLAIGKGQFHQAVKFALAQAIAWNFHNKVVKKDVLI